MSFQFTVPSEHRDFVEWHRGREHYAVWALDLDLPQINSSCCRNQRALRELLLPGYRRQAHVTVALCGFPASTAIASDDYTDGHWRDQIGNMAQAGISPFLLEIGGTHSFASAPYLSVRDVSGGLAELHGCLNPGAGIADDAAYVPHLTLGLYRAAWPAALVWQRLASLPIESCQLEISRVHLMVYQTRVIGGALAKLGYFDLAEQGWRGASGAAGWPFEDWTATSAGGK